MEKAGVAMERVDVSPLVSTEYVNLTAHPSLGNRMAHACGNIMALSCVNSVDRLHLTSGIILCEFT